MNKLKFRIREDVKEINGAAVPDSRIIELTKAQAEYDLSVGRLEKVKPKRQPAPKATKTGAEVNGDDRDT